MYLPRGPERARSCRRASTSPARCPRGSPRRRPTRRSNVPMIPFYIYYSMFGFQRVGDLAWAAGDMRARGFLLGGTAGRTTLNGEGLQHEDGHSHILAVDHPELRLLRPDLRLRGRGHHPGRPAPDVSPSRRTSSTTSPLMNENYAHPAMPEGAEEGILKGMYLLREGEGRARTRRACSLLGSRHDPARGRSRRPSCWRRTSASPPTSGACPSFTELRRDGARRERWNLLHPESRRARAYVDAVPGRARRGRSIAATDYMQALRRPDPALRARRATGCSAPTASAAATTARQLRTFFEVDRYYVAVAALKALADEGSGPGTGAWPRRSRNMASIRRSRTRTTLTRSVQVRSAASTRTRDDAHDRQRRQPWRTQQVTGPRHRRLQGRAGHRDPGEGRRRGQGRGPADHAGIRQGDDGRARAGGGRWRRCWSRSATRSARARRS